MCVCVKGGLDRVEGGGGGGECMEEGFGRGETICTYGVIVCVGVCIYLCVQVVHLFS